MPLTNEEVTQIAEATANALKCGHACRFNDEESEVIHGFGRAMKAHEAGEPEIFIIIQLGKNLADIGKKIGNAILWALIIFGAVIVLGSVIPWRPWK